MPTTVVEASGRTFSDEGYAPRLRRPAWLEGFGAGPCPAGFTYRQAGGRCFCDPALEGFGGLGDEIPCPAPTTTSYRAPPVTKSTVLYRPPRVTTVYKSPPAQEVPALTVEPSATPEPEQVVVPVRKRVSPVVWVAAGGTALTLGWLFFRRKKGR